ncbi:MAG: hypothetical protein KC478_15630 [Bacteriovoracaceae bacterium]|nr:hypothetical protein [Bacteriovoracaceae bacterium]
MNKIVFTLLFALVSTMSFAQDLLLVKATNDEDNEICKLYLELDSKKDISKFRVEKSVDGEIISDDSYDVEAGKTGVVMSKQKGRDIVTLYSHNFSSHNGGDLVLKYLYNGISGNHQEAHLDLQRHADEWKLIMDGKEATHLHFRSNRKMFVGVIGVRSIDIVK